MSMITGSGSVNDPFLINTFEDLEMIGKDIYTLSSYYKLTDDIDASITQSDDYNNGDGWDMIGDLNRRFSGYFNGDGYKIQNVYIDIKPSDEMVMAGFFFSTNEESIIEDIIFENINVNSTYEEDNHRNSGLIVGSNRGTIKDLEVNGEINGSFRTGGITGWNDGDIIDCEVNVKVHSKNIHVGGVTGLNFDNGNVLGCTVVGNITGDTRTGGIVGWNRGDVVNSYFNGEVNGGDFYVGSIVGQNSGEIHTETVYTVNEMSGVVDLTYEDINKGIIDSKNLPALSITNVHISNENNLEDFIDKKYDSELVLQGDIIQISSDEESMQTYMLAKEDGSKTVNYIRINTKKIHFSDLLNVPNYLNKDEDTLKDINDSEEFVKMKQEEREELAQVEDNANQYTDTHEGKTIHVHGVGDSPVANQEDVSSAEDSAKSYTDTHEKKDNPHPTSADKTYVDTKTNEAKSNAKSYTDKEVSDLQGDTESTVEDVENNSKEYTDQKINGIQGETDSTIKEVQDVAISKTQSSTVFIQGDGVTEIFDINHQLETEDIVVGIYEKESKNKVNIDMEILNKDSVRLKFLSTLSAEDEFKVVVIG